jgi:transposase
MARTASGREFLAQAKESLTKAKTISELRQAQAVIFPLEWGISMEQTAAMLGISEGWACQLRRRFISQGGCCDQTSPGRGGRRRENLSREEEAAFLAPLLERAETGGILVVSEIKQALDQRLGRTTALASTYNLLHRHGWRKLVPDKRHPQSDPERQEAWKKNSPRFSPKSTGRGRGKDRSD